MIAPHCIRPASITITASIAACIGCWCAAIVPTERRAPRPDANEAAAVADLKAGIVAREGNDDDDDDRDTHRADSAGDGIRRLGRRRSRPTAGIDAARLLRLPPLLGIAGGCACRGGLFCGRP